MKKNPLFLVGIFLCVFFLTTFVQQAFPQQKLSQPVQKTKGTGKIHQFLKVLQGAKSLKEVQAAFNRAKFSRAEAMQLQRQVEASPSLKNKLDYLYNQAIAAAKKESKKRIRLQATETARTMAQLNAELKARHMKSTHAMKQAIALMRDPEVRCQADAPTISEVSDVMYGEEFIIRGKGFYRTRGTVKVWIYNRIFDAHITQWNSCGVYARIYPQGVRATNQTHVHLRTYYGASVWHSGMRFTPHMVNKCYHEDGYLWGGFFGASEDFTFWGDRRLANDWYVIKTWVEHYQDGHAEVTAAPRLFTPYLRLTTKVHAGVAAGGSCDFTVYQELRGPVGTSSWE